MNLHVGCLGIPSTLQVRVGSRLAVAVFARPVRANAVVPTESACAAYRRAGTRTRRETSPCAPQCKPVEVGRRDRLPHRARLRRLLRALRRVYEDTADGARRRTSSRRTYFDRGLALKARSETLAGEFASMTAVPTISGCCGGHPRLPQHLRREARDPGTRRRPATCRRFWGRFWCPRGVFFADEKALLLCSFLVRPSRIVMATCARPFRAPKMSRMSSRKGRFGAGFPLGVDRKRHKSKATLKQALH